MQAGQWSDGVRLTELYRDEFWPSGLKTSAGYPIVGRFMRSAEQSVMLSSILDNLNHAALNRLHLNPRNAPFVEKGDSKLLDEFTYPCGAFHCRKSTMVGGRFDQGSSKLLSINEFTECPKISGGCGRIITFSDSSLGRSSNNARWQSLESQDELSKGFGLIWSMAWSESVGGIG